MGKCGFRAQGKVCDLEDLHDNCHVDASGFRFIDERWPNVLGNGPSGYPMNNPAFDAAVKKVAEDRKADYEKSVEFRRKLRAAFRRSSD